MHEYGVDANASDDEGDGTVSRYRMVNGKQWCAQPHVAEVQARDQPGVWRARGWRAAGMWAEGETFDAFVSDVGRANHVSSGVGGGSHWASARPSSGIHNSEFLGTMRTGLDLT